MSGNEDQTEKKGLAVDHSAQKSAKSIKSVKSAKYERYILAIDQGTTGTTVAVVDNAANMLSSVNLEHPQIYPKPGWVEHDPEAIWQSVVRGIQGALNKAGKTGDQIAAIGITNQRETVVAWNVESGKPFYNAIVWQCRRTTDFCNRLKGRREARVIKDKTGLVVDPYFSASKIHWLFKNVPGLAAKAKQGQVKVGTIDTFLLWRLTSGVAHKTDVSNASRTQLMNIQTGQWDKQLLKIFQVPGGILPQIVPSSGIFGTTLGVSGLPDGIPIAGIAGDQQAALFGQACFEAGSSKCTFGTGSFLLMNTGTKKISSHAGLLTTVAWQLKGEKKLTYALEGGAFVCGAAVQWLRDEMKWISSSAEIEALAKQVDDTGGVYMVPAFVGLGAPYWNSDARGALLGLTRGTSQAHIARATLEAMALQNVDILLAMQKDLGRKIKAVRVDGGAVRNNLLMQMQADYLGVTVQRPKLTESTVLGAAFLAGLGTGYWPNLKSIKNVWSQETEFKSKISSAERKNKLHNWHQSVERVLVNEVEKHGGLNKDSF